MTDKKIIEAVARALNRARAEEVGGCFRPDDVDQGGECADGDCYCFVWCRGAANETVTAHVAALEAAGFAIVPREPTQEMRDAGHYAIAEAVIRNAGMSTWDDGAHAYRAMIAAAPKPSD